MSKLIAAASQPLAHNGLSGAEAAARRTARGPVRQQRTNRSYVSIVRANVFTVFNLILAVAGAATLVFGEWQDALFLGVLVANTTIGTVQEVRAKRALDRLSALVAPQATVIRDAQRRELIEARTVAVTVLVLVGLYLILALEVSGRVRGAAISTLCFVLLIGYVLVLLVPFARDFFALAPPGPVIIGPALAGAALAISGLAVLDDRFIPGRGVENDGPAGGEP